MKRKFMSKSLIAKIALVLVIVLLLQFAMSEPVRAVDAVSLGGTLLKPIVTFAVFLADGVIQILQSSLTNIEQSFTTIQLKEGFPWSKILAGVAIIVGVILVIAATVFSGGTAAPIIVALAPSILGAGITGAVGGTIYLAVYPAFGKKIDDRLFGEYLTYSNIYITPETILKNQIQLFNVNYFERETIPNGASEEEQTDQTISLSWTLRDIVSQFYITIRNISIVAMLIVMMWVAIRLLLALTPKEKSRYKESIVNCVIGLILIMGMHYAMSLSNKCIEMITNSIAFSTHMFNVPGVGEEVTEDDQTVIDDYLVSNKDAYNKAIDGVTLEVEGNKLYDIIKEAKDKAEEEGTNAYPGIELGEGKTVYIKAANFTEQARYMSQKIFELDAEDKTIETWEYIGWSFVYIVLVILTLTFIWMYGKRTVYMLILTILAPIVGVMYPINRINGSRAQTLNLWFREYFGNLLIQPFHLFIYVILIGSAMAFAINNPIFVIIALFGLVHVEGLLKELIGIRDTKIGSLGKSLQETTRAIKTTERAATSVARSIGRKVSNGISAATGFAASRILANNSNSEENAGDNQQPREQNNPAPIDENLENNPPLNDPPAAGALNPPMEDNTLNNAGQNPLEQEMTPEEERRVALLRQKSELEQAINGMSGKYERDANGNLVEPMELQQYKNDLNMVNRELAGLDNGVRRQSLLRDKAQLEQAIKQEETAGRGNGYIAQEYRRQLDAVNSELNDMGYNDRVYGQMNAIGNNNLDEDTLNAVNELNSTDNFDDNNEIRTIGDNNLDEDTLNAVDELNGTTNLKNNNIDERRNSLLNDKSQLEQAIMEEERNGRGNGSVAQEYRQNLEAVNRELDSLEFIGDNNISNEQTRFEALDGGNEKVIRDYGDTEVLKDKEGNISIRPSENPNGRDPMSMAKVAGNESMSNIDIGVDEGIRSINSGSEALESNSISSGGTATISSSGTTGYGELGSSQSIPDGRKVRTQIREENVNSRDNFNVLTNPNELKNSSISDNRERVIVEDKDVISPSASIPESASEVKQTNSSEPEVITLSDDNFRKIPQSGSGSRRTNVNQNNTVTGTNSSGSATPAGSGTRRTNANSSNTVTGTNSAGSAAPTGSGSSGTNNDNSNKQTKTIWTPQGEIEVGTNNPQNEIPKDTGNEAPTDSGNNQNNTQKQRQAEKMEKIARRVQKGMNIAQETGKRTATAGASAVGRVLDAAMGVATGNLGETVTSSAGIVADTVNVALGGTPKKSSKGNSSSSSKSSTKSSGSQNAQTIVKATEDAKNAMTVEEAEAFEEKCKDKRINNDKTMGLIAAVYQQAPKSDKAKIIKLSAELIKMKQNGKSADDAIKALENDINSKTTEKLLKDLYKEI